MRLEYQTIERLSITFLYNSRKHMNFPQQMSEVFPMRIALFDKPIAGDRYPTETRHGYEAG